MPGSKSIKNLNILKMKEIKAFVNRTGYKGSSKPLAITVLKV